MIKLEIQQAISKALKELYSVDITAKEIVLQKTKKEFTGDYTLVVFPYVKMARKSPEIIANEIGNMVCNNVALVDKFNVIKGFLNFEINDQYWLKFVADVNNDQRYGLKEIDTHSSPIVIEYSSPNTNKPLHLGHIRNNLLGWSVSQLLAANGNNVKKVNLVNDRGIHICKSMLAWKLYGDGETPESSSMKGDHLVGKYYVEFDKYYKAQVKELIDNGVGEEQAQKEAPLMVEAQRMLKLWETGDQEIHTLWQQMNSWVYQGFDQTYTKLGVGFDKIYYESETYLLGKDLVQKGLDLGVLYKKEDGSVWCDLTDEGLDQKLLLRKDGTSVYMTQDLGTALLRHNDFNASQLIYVVGNEQDYHFQVLKIILRRLGFEWADKVYHLSYGMVELPNGKMKSREGTVVDADDLIEEMEQTAAEMSKEHGKNDDLTAEQQQELYHTLALGALKYFILKVDPSKNMLFNPSESIDFNGNTGPFIQYTYARIRSIIRKAHSEYGIELNNKILNSSINEKEREVIKLIHDIPDIIDQAAAAMSPAMIANYVYDIAKSFNSFYQDTPILREQNKDVLQFRVQMCNVVAISIKNLMSILGIDVPERM